MFIAGKCRHGHRQWAASIRDQAVDPRWDGSLPASVWIRDQSFRVGRTRRTWPRFLCLRGTDGRLSRVFGDLRVLAMAPVLDEREKISHVVSRVPRDVVDEVLIVDDGSIDGSQDVARRAGATVIELGQTLGVGAAIRTGYQYAIDNGYDVAVVMAGNNKDSPEEIPLLLAPIARRPGRPGPRLSLDHRLERLRGHAAIQKTGDTSSSFHFSADIECMT